MKLLLYCTKAKPYLYYAQESRTLMDIDNSFEGYKITNKNVDDLLNGKIVAQCDFTVFDIHPCASYKGGTEYGSNCMWATFLNEEDLLKKSCLTKKELGNYLAPNRSSGYGIGIKNLHIFDKPRELSDYFCGIPKKMNTLDNLSPYVNVSIDKAPQNMMYAIDYNDNEYVLISIQPQWLCKILNGEKTIEVRKKVLKEMIK